MSGQNLLLYYGTTMENNVYDCYGMQITFTSNKEDLLATKRKEFFAKFFLYDAQHVDVM